MHYSKIFTVLLASMAFDGALSKPVAENQLMERGAVCVFGLCPLVRSIGGNTDLSASRFGHLTEHLVLAC